jgi:hypothetical protein
MNDWSMRSSLNPLEQSTTFIHSQSNPLSLSSQQQVPNNNNSPGSSTSWRSMKESQRITPSIETKETRSSSSLNLYKIFQQKSNMIVSSSRQQNDSIVPNHLDYHKIEKSYRNTDQAIQTSIQLDSSLARKSESRTSIHKSLPDLSFISQYSKELPRSRTTSSSSIIAARTTPSPTLIHQQKQDSERPRTLKSIKRYKNSKHSTEPLGVFYSPQLRKTFATVPASAIITGSNTTATVMKIKLPSSSSSQPQRQQMMNLKSCLKYGSRANSCDIQAMLQDRKSPVSTSAKVRIKGRSPYSTIFDFEEQPLVVK